MNEIRFRCWIDKEGSRFLGPGRVELLELIQEEGSVSKAAARMGMSYKKAWDMVDDLNKRGKEPFVLLRKGGKKGGGAEITESAKNIVSRYLELTQKLKDVLESEGDLLKTV